MKIFKNIWSLILIVAVLSSCEKDDPDYNVDTIKAPSNLEIMFDVAQDNSGLVTILPTAEGVTTYKVLFGDVENEVATEFGLKDVIEHTYTEGNYTVKVIAVGATGLTTDLEENLAVSYLAPENMEVIVTPNTANPKIIEVSATAKYSILMDYYFGDVENEVPVTVLPEEVVEHTYAEAGDYELKVVARGAGAATTEYTELISISEATDPVVLPIDFESYTVSYSFVDFGGAVNEVIDNPYAEGINTSARIAQFTKTAGAETWAGTLLTLANPIDFSSYKLMKMKVWSPKSGITVKMKVENIDNGDIAMEIDATTSVSNEWEELVFDFSAIDDQAYQNVVVFFDFDAAGDDAIYYFDDIKQGSSAPSTGIVGTWKMAPEAGSLGVGPAQGDISWWAIDEQGVADRACYFDDEFVFAANGSFSNVLGAESWIEGWQGGGDACGTPVAPHDGSAVATYVYSDVDGSLTLNGVGAYMGIPKAYNGGELTTPVDAPESITYIIEMQDNESTMILDIEVDGAWWRFKLVKDGGGGVSSPLAGTWQMALEAGSLGVGPGQGDISWWAIDDAGLTQRACYFDDTYVFGDDGSFSNVLGTDTWIEAWQGIEADGCGTPVAPHNGSNPATFTYDEAGASLTLNGVGAYLGIPKANNDGELTTPDDAPESISYLIELQDDGNTMIIDIETGAGSGVWWRYKLVKL